MTKIKALLVAASLFAFAGNAAAENKPTETETGNLDFRGVSDRELNEFIAENLHLMNRRLGSIDFQLLNAMAKMRFLTPDQYMVFSQMALSQSKASILTINPNPAEFPGGKSALDNLMNPPKP